jgi:flagellar protein FliS
MYPNAARAYQAQQVQGVSKVKQVALLYDRMLASLREAIQAIEDNEIEKRHWANKRAQDIILALYGALDVEVGGEVAENLQKLYLFSLRRLPRVDLKNDPEPAREVIQVLEPLRDSWHELARRETAGTLYDAPAEGTEAAAQGSTAAKATPESSTASPQDVPAMSGIDLAG